MISPLDKMPPRTMSYIQSKISTNTYVDERDTDTHIYVPLQVK